jgi:hypothetical protein
VLRLLRADARPRRYLGSHSTRGQSAPAWPCLQRRISEPCLLPGLPRETLSQQRGKSLDQPRELAIVRATSARRA